MLALLLLAIPALLIALNLDFFRSLIHQKRLAASIPGPPGVPFFGNLFDIKRTAEDMPIGITKRGNDYGKRGIDMTRSWIMWKLIVTPFTGRAVKAILDSSEEISKGNEYDIVSPWLGRGLLLITGDAWRHRRRLLTPTFHFNQLDSYIAAMNRHAKIFVHDILPDLTGSTVDLYPYIKLCTLDIICETAMGKDLDSQHNPTQPYVTAIQRIMRLAVGIVSNPIYWFRPVRVLSGFQAEYDEAISTAKAFTFQASCCKRDTSSLDVIAERKAALEAGEVEPNKRAFLDMLLEQTGENRLSEEILREEVDTFMFAGHDTTASGLAWAIWCLACNPEAQERAAAEVRQIFASDEGRDATRADVHAMSYLDRCIKESLRLFPPAPLIMRKLQADFKIDDHIVPRGATVSISPFAVHRNETVFENALSFDPDRFLPERMAGRHPYDYIPFSAGPRNCIGQKFAAYEERVVTSWLLRYYRFEADMGLHENPPLAEVILRPKYGCRVRVTKR